MKEVRKCSLCGVAFTFDADAYETLSEYLKSLRTNYRDTADGEEILADIEARIAELILSVQDNVHVVGKALVLNIICQIGSAEDISEADLSDKRHGGTPRIPRRLYRDTENAKLGGVCSGIGRYFDIDPVWVRLAFFAPLLLVCFGGVPFFTWMIPVMSNLFGVFMVCYLIMWFAVPAARTARQKLEMNGERITEQTIRRTTESRAPSDPDRKARSVVAELVAVLGKVMLILMKIFMSLLVFGFILAACGLIVCMFALLVGGGDIPLWPRFLNEVSIWVPVLGIFVVLVPIILLIYVMMCLIASRKPGGRTILALFVIWCAGCIAAGCLFVRGDTVRRIRDKVSEAGRLMDSELIVDGDTTTLRRVLAESDDGRIVESNSRSLHITVPSKELDIVVDKRQKRMEVAVEDKNISFKGGDGAQTLCSDGALPGEVCPGE